MLIPQRMSIFFCFKNSLPMARIPWLIMRPPPPKSDELPQSLARSKRCSSQRGPLLHLVWQTNPRLCIATLVLRLVAAFLPLAMLWIPKLIIDLVVRVLRHQTVDTSLIWKLLILEFCSGNRFRCPVAVHQPRR